MNHQTIRELADPRFRYLFLDDSGVTEAFLISGLEENTFLIHHQAGVLPEKERRGFFVAAEGRGIVRFEGDCKSIRKGERPLDLYRLHINLEETKLINRREFFRHYLKKPVDISFHYDKKEIMAQLVNISEGGMRLNVEEPLPSNVIFQFNLCLDVLKAGFTFRTDGMIIYCVTEDDPDLYMTGIAFVAPDFVEPKEKEAYQASLHELLYLLENQR